MTRRYPAYRESGADWLGPLPVGWAVMNPRRIFSQEREPAQTTDEQLSATQKSGVIPQRLYMEQEDQKVVLALAGLDNFKRVKAGDFVISLRSFQGGIERSSYDGCVSPAYTVLRPKMEIDGGYFRYLLKTDEFILKLQSVTSGIRDGRNVSYEQFALVPLSFPPLPEQTAIAAFLDRETAKIDALVAEQRRLIDLLKEKRQAVISHAVTRGLNPTAKLKPSGVDWLGDVPEGWAFGKLGHFAWLQGGFAFPSEAFGSEGVAVVKMTNLDRGSLAFENAAYIPEDAALERVALKEGDLVWGMSGSVGETGSLGNFARVRLENLPCQLNQRVGRFVALTDSVSLDFLEFIIQSRNFYEQVLLWVTGTAQFNISSEQVQSCKIAVPPRAEQAEIVAFLKQTLGEFDTLMQTAEAAITLLQERRAALISAAVTGKIDVRDLAPQETEAA